MKTVTSRLSIPRLLVPVSTTRARIDLEVLYSSNVLWLCVSVCSLSPPRSSDRSLPNLVGVCRWTSHLPLRGSLSKGQRVTFTILYMIADNARLTPPRCKKHTAYDDTRLTPHRCKKHTASFARSTGIFPSEQNMFKFGTFGSLFRHFKKFKHDSELWLSLF